MIGPPTVPPKLLYRFFGRIGAKKFRASSLSFRKNSNSVPWNALLPDLVTMFTCAPPFRPYSAEYALRSMRTSAMASRSHHGEIVAIERVDIAATIERPIIRTGLTAIK